jgi:hypothetical protein
VITPGDAEAIASLLAPQLPPASAMGRLADIGDVDAAALARECQALKGRTWRTPDIETWIARLEHYLAARANPSPDVSAAETSVNPHVEEGISEHGDAFRAFLTLPDTDPNAADLPTRFEDVYIGSYSSISELADELTELPACKEEITRVAGRWGFEELFTVDQEKLRMIADAIWDIVELDGKVHVFSK